jgi:hypothetical protein
MADSAVWVAAITAVSSGGFGLAGYVFAARNDERRDERAAEREEVARKDARSERLDDERQAFQREVLLELQDCLREVTRATAQVLTHDRATLKEHDQLYMVGDDLNKQSHEAGISLTRLRERVLSDDLRAELAALHRFETELELMALRLRKLAPAEAIREIDRAFSELATRHERVNDLLGQELRKVLGRR